MMVLWYDTAMKTFDAVQHMLDATRTSKRGLSLRMSKSENYLGSIMGANSDTGAMNLAAIASEMGYSLLLVSDEGEAIEIDPVE